VNQKTVLEVLWRSGAPSDIELQKLAQRLIKPN